MPNTIGLGDTTGLYHGTQQINQGQMDRWNIVTTLNYRPHDDELKIVLAKSPTSPPPWSKPAATADHAAVPQVIFTDPEVASVGFTEAEARKKGVRVRVVEYDIGHVSGAQLTADGYSGLAKMVVDEDRRVLVGITFIGQDVGEMIHAGTIAVVGEVPLDRLWHAVPSYPTMSEIWLRLLETYGL